jgi:hypothetical protein
MAPLTIVSKLFRAGYSKRRIAGRRCKIMQRDANFDPSGGDGAASLVRLVHLPSVRAACQKAAFWRRPKPTLSSAPAQIMERGGEDRGGARPPPATHSRYTSHTNTSDARRMGCARLLIFHRRPNKITIKKNERRRPGAGQSFLRVARE